MKVIVAGGRNINDQALVDAAIAESGFEVTEIVSGKARGVDTCGEVWALWHDIPVKEFPAIWRDRDGVYDSAAGFRRNSAMARYAEALVAVWDGRSTGTKHMLDQAAKMGLKVFIKPTPIADMRKVTEMREFVTYPHGKPEPVSELPVCETCGAVSHG